LNIFTSFDERCAILFFLLGFKYTSFSASKSISPEDSNTQFYTQIINTGLSRNSVTMTVTVTSTRWGVLNTRNFASL